MSKITTIPLRGVNRVPDDTASAQGSLEMAVNMANDGAGLKMLEKPVELFKLLPGEKCLRIHEAGGYKHYIMLRDGALYWCEAADDYARKRIGTIDGSVSCISSMGNIIMLTDATGIRYYVWRQNEGDTAGHTYIDLGQHPSMVNIQFALDSEMAMWPNETYQSGKYKGQFKEPYTIRGKVSNSDVPLPTFSDTRSWVAPKPVIATMPEDKDTTGHGGWLPYTDYDFEGKTGENGTDVVKTFWLDITQKVDAAMNKFIAERGTDKNKFIMPFYVRYAYEMFDGSLIMQSYPVLMIPNSRGPIFAMNGTCDYFAYGSSPDYYHVDSKGVWVNNSDGCKTYPGFELDYEKDNKVRYTFRGRVYAFASQLRRNYFISQDSWHALQKWKGLIRSLNIYVTPPIYSYDQNGTCWGWKCMDGDTPTDLSAWDSYYTISRIAKNFDGADTHSYKKWSFAEIFRNVNESFVYGKDHFFKKYNDVYSLPSYILKTAEFSEEEYRKDLVNRMQFFLLERIDFDDIYKQQGEREVKIDKDALKMLATNEQMVDDYHSNDTLSTSVMYPYNHRINLGGVLRTMHNPLAPITQWCRCSDGLSDPWRIAIYIKNNTENAVVVSDEWTQSGAVQWAAYAGDMPLFVFYPNAQAYKAVLTRAGKTYQIKLKQHPLLEGAYWLNNIWTKDNTIFDAEAVTTPLLTSNNVVDERSKIYTSNVDTPFAFDPDNINTAGDGTIKALCANTQAVNSFQFGYAQMYCFTSSGVWPMRVDEKNGGWQNVQPSTRDVITDGTQPLQLDQSIVFLTARGVLRLDINSSIAKPMSFELDAHSDANYHLLDKLLNNLDSTGTLAAAALQDPDRFWAQRGCVTAYDYRDGRLYFRAPNAAVAWVYNAKSGLWTQATTRIDQTLNAYPNCEIVSGDAVMEIGSSQHYNLALAMTRPIVTAPGYYAKVRELAVSGRFDPRGSDVATALYATRNWQRYALVGSSTSRRITRIGGSAYRAHTALMVVNTQSQDLTLDTLALTVDVEQTNKLR